MKVTKFQLGILRDRGAIGVVTRSLHRPKQQKDPLWIVKVIDADGKALFEPTQTYATEVEATKAGGKWCEDVADRYWIALA